MKLKKADKATQDSIDEQIEILRDEVGPGDVGFNEFDGFIIGYYGYDMFNDSNGDRDGDDYIDALIEEVVDSAKNEHPGYEPVHTDLTYDPADDEHQVNAVFVAFIPKKRKNGTK